MALPRGTRSARAECAAAAISSRNFSKSLRSLALPAVNNEGAWNLRRSTSMPTPKIIPDLSGVHLERWFAFRAGAPFLLLFAMLYSAFGAASPFLPAFMEARGVPAEQIGIIFGVATAIRLISAPIAGRIADRTGALRATLSVCTIATALAALGYVSASGFWALLAISLLHRRHQRAHPGTGCRFCCNWRYSGASCWSRRSFLAVTRCTIPSRSSAGRRRVFRPEQPVCCGHWLLVPRWWCSSFSDLGCLPACNRRMQ
jgi:hypothetical protein